MYNIRFDQYVPEPHPVTSNCIVAAHYYAAWKKGAARIHEGFNDLAETFPDRTPLMGYYDEENPEVCDWEIKWAVEHGINCFIYCWYRNHDNMGKPVTVNDLRCGHGIHEALFHARYQNYINFAIMYEASPRWGGGDAEDMVNNLMPFWTENYFKRPNYLKIDNKPVLFVYQNARLKRDFFPEASAEKEAWDRCREYAKAQGFDGLIIAAENTMPTKEEAEDIVARGFDFRFGYDSGWEPTYNYPPVEEIHEGQINKLKTNLNLDPMRYIATPTCFHDSTPRYTQRWQDFGYHFQNGVIWYQTPEEYRTLIQKMKAEIEKLPENAWSRKIFMIDNWNEWDEGHFVSPSHKYGFKFLQAIREELTQRDNLPDYRTPQDIGFTGYNQSWVTPDFEKFCEEKYGKRETT